MSTVGSIDSDSRQVNDLDRQGAHPQLGGLCRLRQDREIAVGSRKCGRCHGGIRRAPDRLREAVEQQIVDLFVGASNQVLIETPASEVTAVRAKAVAVILVEDPAVAGYLRRAGLDSNGPGGRFLEMTTTLSAQQVPTLREAGLASAKHRDSDQVIGMMARQLGQLFLQPTIDSVRMRISRPEDTEEDKSRVMVGVQSAKAGGRR